MEDTFSVLGSSKCEVLSILDLKDAFHSLRLSENSMKYCGILPYFGSASYLYQRIPMGLNISPSIWQSYINAILNCLQSKKYCEAMMDDLLLFTPSKGAHMAKLEDLLKALLKNRLKISLKKCQLFRTNLQYMGNRDIHSKQKGLHQTSKKHWKLWNNSLEHFLFLRQKREFSPGGIRTRRLLFAGRAP